MTERLAKPSKKCQKELDILNQDFGITPDEINTELGVVTQSNGNTSPLLEKDLFDPDDKESAYAFWAGNGFTIAKFFKTNPQVGAETGFPGTNLSDNIFWSPQFVNSSSQLFVAATLMHELLHALGPDDKAIQVALFGANSPQVGAPSQNISDILKKDCF